jgi:hypothetical protein
MCLSKYAFNCEHHFSFFPRFDPDYPNIWVNYNLIRDGLQYMGVTIKIIRNGTATTEILLKFYIAIVVPTVIWLGVLGPN